MGIKWPFVLVELVLAIFILADSMHAGSGAILTGRVTDTTGAVIAE